MLIGSRQRLRSVPVTQDPLAIGPINRGLRVQVFVRDKRRRSQSRPFVIAQISVMLIFILIGIIAAI